MRLAQLGLADRFAKTIHANDAAPAPTIAADARVPDGAVLRLLEAAVFLPPSTIESFGVKAWMRFDSAKLEFSKEIRLRFSVLEKSPDENARKKKQAKK